MSIPVTDIVHPKRIGRRRRHAGRHTANPAISRVTRLDRTTILLTKQHAIEVEIANWLSEASNPAGSDRNHAGCESHGDMVPFVSVRWKSNVAILGGRGRHCSRQPKLV